MSYCSGIFRDPNCASVSLCPTGIGGPGGRAGTKPLGPVTRRACGTWACETPGEAPCLVGTRVRRCGQWAPRRGGRPRVLRPRDRSGAVPAARSGAESPPALQPAGQPGPLTRQRPERPRARARMASPPRPGGSGAGLPAAGSTAAPGGPGGLPGGGGAGGAGPARNTGSQGGWADTAMACGRARPEPTGGGGGGSWGRLPADSRTQRLRQGAAARPLIPKPWGRNGSQRKALSRAQRRGHGWAEGGQEGEPRRLRLRTAVGLAQG